jgi:DNA-binding HxlR family transcriptional regulator
MDDSGGGAMILKQYAESTVSTKILQQSLEEIRGELNPLLKSLANPKRFVILIALLGGSSSFQSLLNHLQIQKTALANHLTSLKQVSLIHKPEYGTYAITEDGVHFLRTLHQGWHQSLRAQEIKARQLQHRAMSQQFVTRILHIQPPSQNQEQENRSIKTKKKNG